LAIASITAGVRAGLAGLPAETQRAWKWDILTGLLAGLYQGCIWTFVARVARADLHATYADMGWIAAAPALGYVFATVWARQMDGRSKMPFVFWTWLFARGAFMLAPLLHSRQQFVLLVCSTPFVFSVSMPAYTAIMKDIYPDHQRGRLMSFVRMGMSMATLSAALTMGRLLDNGLSWQMGFFIGGVLGALSAFTFSRIRVPAGDDNQNDRMSARAFFADTVDILRRNPGYRWFSASVFVSGFGNLVATTLYPIYQVDVFHISNTQVANMQNISSIATIVGFFFWGGFLDRRGPLAAVLAALAFNLAVPLLYAQAWSMSALYIASASMGLCVAGIDLAYLNTTLLFAEPGKAAQYQALHSSFFGVRGSIAPQFAIPLMRGVGFRTAFLASFDIISTGVWLQVISMRDYRRQHAHDRRTSPARDRQLAEVD
jgi:MFS family permease